MKIDTINKTIEFDYYENIGEAMDKLRLMLPNDEWKEYKVTTERQYITYPILPVQPIYPTYPVQDPIYPTIIW